MSGTDIFLSYARADRATARIIADSLADEGFSVWWDASLHSGETFDEVIEQHLREAKAVVVLWSPRSVASRWVRAEATQADRRNKLAPAIIEPCDRPIIFELTHAADLCDWAGDVTDVRWRMFIDDLGHLIDRVSSQEAQGSPAPQPAAKAPTRAPAVARQPLRPGSEDVIIAARARRPQPAEQAPIHEIAEPPRLDDEASDEVHCLELEDGELAHNLFVIDGSGTKVGRTPPADIVLPDKSVSREHCVLALANDDLFVTDLNSTNGTYIDDVRVARTTILPVGAVLRIGQVALRHAVRSASEAAGVNDDGSGLPPRRVAAAR